MIKKLLLIILLVIIIALGGGYFYVSNIDWNKHKGVIAEKFFEATGKKISFSGPVSFSFLPYPTLQATNLKITNQNAKIDDTPLMEIKSLNADLEFVPLLSGKMNVTLMTLQDPMINIIKNEEGTYNWLDGVNDALITKLKEADLILNSLTLKNASLNYNDETTGKKIVLNKLNTEIIAPTLLGPFNIDGSYTKDNQPAGFSIALGELSNRFATTLNFALSHPNSETSVRFDGSFLTENSSINGDVLFSSRKLKDFVNLNFKDYKLVDEYNYPLVFNFEYAKNKEKIELKNFVFEYGASKGAGNIVIPKNFEGKDNFVPVVEANFNLTDLDFNPVVAFVLNTLKSSTFSPSINFDLQSSLNVLKTQYRNEVIEDLALELNINKGVFAVKTLKATMPEGANGKLSGDFYSNNGAFTYSFNTEFLGDDLHYILNWLGVAPKKYNENTYKKFSFNSIIEGNNKQIKIGNMSAMVDKSTIYGNVGIALEDRINLFLSVETDSVNVDDYIAPFSEAEGSENIIEILNARLNSLKILNDFDAQLKTKSKLVIFNSHPVEDFNFEANLTLGQLNISDISAANFAGASFDASGILKDFGSAIMAENVKYKIIAKNFFEFANKTKIKLAYIKNEALGFFDAQGIITGKIDNFNTKTILKFDTFNASYSGNVKLDEQFKNVYKGELAIQASDFINFTKLIGFDYKPATYSLGTMILQTDIEGGYDNFLFSNMFLNIGDNEFNGDFMYQNNGRAKIETNLDVNKFDTNRFFYITTKDDEKKQTVFAKKLDDKNVFILKPEFEKKLINYDFYKTFDMNANINFDQLDVEAYSLYNAKLSFNILADAINISNLEATHKDGDIKANAALSLIDNNAFKGSFTLNNQKLAKLFNAGETYGFLNTVFDANFTNFETRLDSLRNALDNISTTVDLTLKNTTIRGLDFAAIKSDLIQRDTASKLSEAVSKALSSGETKMPEIKTVVNIKEGAFDFSSAFNLDDEAIELKTTGSIKDWSMDAKFDVKYLKTEYLLPYSFNLKGSINNPQLAVNVEALTTLFAEREEEFERQRRQREDQRVKSLGEAMMQQQETAQGLSQQIALLNNNIKAKKENSLDGDIIKRYDELMLETNKMLSTLDEVFLQKGAINFEEKLITELEEKNQSVKDAIRIVEDNEKSIYKEDIKHKIKIGFDSVASDYNLSKNIARDFSGNYSQMLNKLSSIESSYDLAKDAEVINLSKEQKSYVVKINDFYLEAQKNYETSIASDNIITLDDIYITMSNTKKTSADVLEYLQKANHDLMLYMNAVFERENNLFIEAKRKIEIEEKIKENTSLIAVEDKKILTIRKDIKEIEKEEKNNQELKIIDFSKTNENQSKSENEDKSSKKTGVIVIE